MKNSEFSANHSPEIFETMQISP